MSEYDDLAVKVAELGGEMRSGFARVEGALGTMASGLDATRRELDQMVKFQSELIKQHDHRLHQLEVDRVADRDRAASDSSAVRVGLEARIDAAVSENRAYIEELQRRTERHDSLLEGISANRWSITELREDIDELQRRADRQDGLIKALAVLGAVVGPAASAVLVRLIT